MAIPGRSRAAISARASFAQGPLKLPWRCRRARRGSLRPRLASQSPLARAAQRVVRSAAFLASASSDAPGSADVELHLYIAVESRLCLDRLFGRYEFRGAVDMGTEAHALFAEPSQRGQREDLKAARIREEVAPPSGKAVEAARRANGLVARPQVQVVGIRQYYGKAQFREGLGPDGLDRRIRPYRHEGRGLDLAVGQPKAPRPAPECPDLRPL